jgi:hypothetical protein
MNIQMKALDTNIISKLYTGEKNNDEIDKLVNEQSSEAIKYCEDQFSKYLELYSPSG